MESNPISIKLRDFNLNDLEPFHFWNLPGNRWQELDGPYYPKMTEVELVEKITRLRGKIQAGEIPEPRVEMAIADANTDALLGTVTRYWQSAETNWLSIGIVIYNPENWGKGIGLQALSQWCDYLFATMPEIVRLDMRTWSGNAGLMRLAVKLGFQQEACFRMARIVHGEYYDGLAFGILRSEWENKGW